MSLIIYKAPWGRTLQAASWFCVALGFIIPAMVCFADRRNPFNWLVAGGIYWFLMLGAALFIIRSYTVGARELLIERLFWTTRVPLNDLQSAGFQPEAMRGSWRLWGNGGMLSITGWYRNRALGTYRAFVTELKNTVVLRFANKTIVVSPENPEQFVSEISAFANRNA